MTKTLIQTVTCQLSCNSISRSTRTRELRKLSCQVHLQIHVILFADKPGKPHSIRVVDVKSKEVTITWKSPICELKSNTIDCHPFAVFNGEKYKVRVNKKSWYEWLKVDKSESG